MATPVFLPGKTEDPGGLKSMGSQRVAHDSVTKQHQQYVINLILIESYRICTMIIFILQKRRLRQKEVKYISLSHRLSMVERRFKFRQTDFKTHSFNI